MKFTVNLGLGVVLFGQLVISAPIQTLGKQLAPVIQRHEVETVKTTDLQLANPTVLNGRDAFAAPDTEVKKLGDPAVLNS